VATYVKAAVIKIKPQMLKKLSLIFLNKKIQLLCIKYKDLIINMPQFM